MSRTNGIHWAATGQVLNNTDTGVQQPALTQHSLCAARSGQCAGHSVIVSRICKSHHVCVGSGFANGSGIVFDCFISHSHFVTHNTSILTVVIGIVRPISDQGIDQDVFSKLSLVHSIDTDVSKKRRFGIAGATEWHSAAVTFTDITPVIDHLTWIVNVSGIITKTSRCANHSGHLTILIGHVVICLARIFVVVLKIIVPHVANQVAAVVVEFKHAWLVFNFGLCQSFAIVLIQCVNTHLITG